MEIDQSNEGSWERVGGKEHTFNTLSTMSMNQIILLQFLVSITNSQSTILLVFIFIIIIIVVVPTYALSFLQFPFILQALSLISKWHLKFDRYILTLENFPTLTYRYKFLFQWDRCSNSILSFNELNLILIS